MKRFIAYVASRMFFGFVGFYLLAGFIALSFGIGLLMKFGVLSTPGFLRNIYERIQWATYQTWLYVLGIFIHLAQNPLDFVFTILAACLIGKIIYAMHLSSSTPTPPARHYPRNLPMRGATIQSINLVQQQLADRRRRAQRQLDEQYSKFTVV